MDSLFKLETSSGSYLDSLKILNSHGSSKNVNPWLKYNIFDSELFLVIKRPVCFPLSSLWLW